MAQAKRSEKSKPAESWAPPDLLELYNRRHDLDAPEYAHLRNQFMPSISKLAIEMLEKFVTEQHMEPVWSKLKSVANAPDPRDGRSPYPCGSALFHVCQAAMVEWSRRPKHTKVQKRRALREISEKTRQLVALLDDSVYFAGREVEELMEDREVLSLVDTIRTPSMGGLPVAAGQGSIDSRDMDVVLLRVLTWGNVPTISSLLNRLAEEASKRAASPQVWTRKPGATNAQAHFFVRYLSAYFRRQYKNYWDELVAIVTNVVLGTELGPETVQGLRRSFNFEHI